MDKTGKIISAEFNELPIVYGELLICDNIIYNYEGTKTMIEGHTAPVGSSYEKSLPLSEQRAANVKAYCLSAETGIDVSKLQNNLQDVGYGNSQPIYSENGEVDMAASRRVAFRFFIAIEL